MQEKSRCSPLWRGTCFALLQGQAAKPREALTRSVASKTALLAADTLDVLPGH